MKAPWIYRAFRHADCVADPEAYCVRPGCSRSAAHAQPLAVSTAGELVEELTCCRHH